jgi:hypothetical protein
MTPGTRQRPQPDIGRLAAIIIAPAMPVAVPIHLRAVMVGFPLLRFAGQDDAQFLTLCLAIF